MKCGRTHGTTTEIVGGILSISGGIAIILTAGAATPLLIAGMGVAFAGAGKT